MLKSIVFLLSFSTSSLFKSIIAEDAHKATEHSYGWSAGVKPVPDFLSIGVKAFRGLPAEMVAKMSGFRGQD